MLKISLKSFCPLLCYSVLQPPQLCQLSPNIHQSVAGHTGILVTQTLSRLLWLGGVMGLKLLLKACQIWQYYSEPTCFSISQLVDCWGSQSCQGPFSWYRLKFPVSLCPIQDPGNRGKGFHMCSSAHFCSYESLLGSWTQDKWLQNTSELPSLELMTGAGCSWCSCCQWPGSCFHTKECVIASLSFSWKI